MDSTLKHIIFRYLSSTDMFKRVREIKGICKREIQEINDICEPDLFKSTKEINDIYKRKIEEIKERCPDIFKSVEEINDIYEREIEEIKERDERRIRESKINDDLSEMRNKIIEMNKEYKKLVPGTFRSGRWGRGMRGNPLWSDYSEKWVEESKKGTDLSNTDNDNISKIRNELLVENKGIYEGTINNLDLSLGNDYVLTKNLEQRKKI